MNKFEAFVVKHEKPILNYGTVLFLIPVMVLAVMGDINTSVAVLGGYVVFGTLFSFIICGEMRRVNRRARTLNGKTA